MYTCPNCNSNNTVRNGLSKTASQRHLCKECGYRFTKNTNVRKENFYFITKAVQLWLEGLTYQIISEIIGFSPEKVSKMIAPYKDLLLPIRKDLVFMEGLRIERKNDFLMGFHKEKVRLPIHTGGILFVGYESEILCVSKKC